MLTLTLIRTGTRTSSTDVDVFIAACGYEGSARGSPEFHETAKKKLAIGFASQHEREYEANSGWFESADFDFIEVSDDAFSERVDQYLLECASERSVMDIEIDISCFNRFRLAHLVDALRSLLHKR